MTAAKHPRQDPAQLLAQLEAAVESQFGPLERFQFIDDCPFAIGDTNGGIDSTAPEYQALAIVTFARWLRHHEAMFRRAKVVMQRREAIRVVSAR